MSTYLSIDLDYWGFQRNSRSLCTRFFKRVFALDVPILVVRDHHQLLGDVNRSGCHRIEHIDYHSDLVEDPRLARKYTSNKVRDLWLNCGTWLNYVNWRHRGKVMWRYPSKHCYGTKYRGWGVCHDVLNPFEYDVSGWRAADHSCGIRGVWWKDISRVGVAISAEYWIDNGESFESVLPKLVGINKRPYNTWYDEMETGRFDGFARRI